jgi:myo-inositol 2-dehydrogenase / D-chiro-inositol 1-dehydrogenase
VRVAVLGAGRMGSFHTATLREIAAVDELLLADLDGDRAAAVANMFDAHAVPGPEELFAAQPDAIVIATTTRSHNALLRRCAELAIPAFCEKPVCLDSATCTRLVKDLSAHGAQVQVGFQRRFDLGFLNARRLVESGELGQIYNMRMISFDTSPPSPGFLATSGGIFHDLQIHDFDQARWLTGQEVREVYAAGVNVGDKALAPQNDFDEAATVLILSDDTLVSLVSGRHNPAGYDVRIELAGSKGTISAGRDERAPVKTVEDPAKFPAEPYTDCLDRFRNAYVTEIRTFIDMVEGRIANPCPLDAALNALLVADAAKRSARERRPIPVAEIAL